MSEQGYQTTPFPKLRRLMVDGGQLGRQKHLVHGLFEVDVTAARRLLRQHKARTGEALSFTAFIIACLGRAVEGHRQVQAYRTWGDRLMVFDAVDVNTMFEVEVDGRKLIRPHIIRAANRKGLREIHDEIRGFQAQRGEGREANFIGWFVLLPAFVRRLCLRLLFRSPRWRREMNGTVSLTSVGMFGAGGGWGIPVSNHTLQVTLGGVTQRPALVNGQLENREYLCVTLSLDHDIVDGAPAARFAQAFKSLVEGGAMLVDLTAQGENEEDDVSHP